jgi:hypothetical protein
LFKLNTNRAKGQGRESQTEHAHSEAEQEVDSEYDADGAALFLPPHVGPRLDQLNQARQEEQRETQEVEIQVLKQRHGNTGAATTTRKIRCKQDTRLHTIQIPSPRYFVQLVYS